jgi:neutral ceramidase
MMRRIWLRLSLAAVLISCSAGPEDKRPGKLSPLRAGVGQALIDLPIGHSTAGYLQSTSLAFSFPKNEPGSPFADLFPATRGTYAPPKAKAVLLDNGLTTLALVRIDAIFTTDILTARAVELARERLDLDLRERLILSATHTHGAGCRFGTSLRVKLLESLDGWQQDALGHGVDSFNPESVNRVANSIVDAIETAWGDMRPAALGYARKDATEGSNDRRCQDDALYGAGNIDRALRLIRIDEVDDAGASQGPMALLLNFAMHGTVYGAYNHLLSADAPGLIEYKLEERFDRPVMAMFMQGTAGDVSPGGEGEGSQKMEDVGHRVADQVYSLAQAVTGAAEAEAVYEFTREVPIKVKSRRIPLQHSLLGYEEGEFMEDGGILCQMGVNDSCPAPHADGSPRDVSPVSPGGVSCLGKGLPGQGKYHTDLLVAQVGPLTIATLPGEPVSEVGRQVLAAAAAEGLTEVLLYGYAQDHNGYLLMPDDWLRGGYEPTISYWGWKFVPYLLAQQADLMRELVSGKAAGKKAAPKVHYPSLDTAPVPAVPGKKAPGFVVPPEESYPRLTELVVAWSGGDPVLGLPHVTVEHTDGSQFGPLKFQGWRPVDNTTYEITTEYAAAPSYATFKQYKAENPQGDDEWGRAPWVPAHTWRATWGIPAWAPAGRYRVRIRGEMVSAVDGPTRPYELLTEQFEVVANNLLGTQNVCDGTGDGVPDTSGDYFAVATDASGIHVRIAAFYPQSAPSWDERFNDGDDQLANFRLWTQRGTTAFPWAGPLQGKVTVKRDGAPVGEVELTWHGDGKTAPLKPHCPGASDLPYAAADFRWQGPGAYEVEFATGDITDAHGNLVVGRASAPIVR